MSESIKEALFNLLTRRDQDAEMQSALRDILTDLRHIAKEEKLDFSRAVDGSRDVFREEHALDGDEIAYNEVFQGIEFLDNWNASWARLVNLDTLDVEAFDNCIVCQVTGLKSFTGALIRLGIYDEEPQWVGKGFDFPFHDPDGRSQPDWWASADRLWRKAIADRLA